MMSGGAGADSPVTQQRVDYASVFRNDCDRILARRAKVPYCRRQGIKPLPISDDSVLDFASCGLIGPRLLRKIERGGPHTRRSRPSTAGERDAPVLPAVRRASSATTLGRAAKRDGARHVAKWKRAARQARAHSARGHRKLDASASSSPHHLLASPIVGVGWRHRRGSTKTPQTPTASTSATRRSAIAESENGWVRERLPVSAGSVAYERECAARGIARSAVALECFSSWRSSGSELRLRIPHQGLSPDHTEVLCAAVEAHAAKYAENHDFSGVWIDLTDDDLGEGGATSLAALFARSKATRSSLRSLELASNHIGDDGARQLCRSLAGGGHSLQMLSLRHNGLSDACTAAIVEAVADSYRSLKTLDLGVNEFSGASATSFFRPLGGARGQKLRVVSSSQSLAEGIGDSLRANRTLADVRLGWNRLRGSAVHLVRGAAESVALRRLCLAFNALPDEVGVELGKTMLMPSSFLQLSSLDLTHNELRSASGFAIAEALASPQCALPCLRVLQLGFNPLGKEACVALIESVSTADLSLVPELGQELEGDVRGAGNTLEHLGLENALIGDMPATRRPALSPAAVPNFEGAVPASKGAVEGEARFCGFDGPWQHLWELSQKQQATVNRRRTEQNSGKSLAPPLVISTEFPPQRRKMRVTLPKSHSNENESSVSPLPRPSLKLGSSAFRDRPRECDSRAFFDSFKVLNAAFAWDIELMRTKLPRFVKDEAQQRAVEKSWGERYVVLSNVHAFYAAESPVPSLFAINFTSFLDLVRDCGLQDDEDGGAINSSVIETAFIAANVEIEDANTSPEMLLANEENPDKALTRHELMEALTRIAIKKFASPQSVRRVPSGPVDMGIAVAKLLNEHLVPRARRHSPNVWRRDHLYWLDVHTALSEQEELLRSVWRRYRGRELAEVGRHVELMTLSEWTEMIAAAKLLSPHFTTKEATQAFVHANMRTNRDLARKAKAKRRDMHSALTWTEFLEAIVRIAEAQISHEQGLPANALLSQKLGALLLKLFECMRDQTKDSLWTTHFVCVDKKTAVSDHQGGKSVVGDEDEYQFLRFRELHEPIIGGGIVTLGSNGAIVLEEAGELWAFEDHE